MVADRLRSTDSLLIHVLHEETVQQAAFPMAKHFAMNLPIEGGIAHNVASEAEWVNWHHQLLQDRSFYYRKGNKNKKTGLYGVRKEKQNGVIDAFFSFPRWWTEELAAAIDSEELDIVSARKKIAEVGGLVVKNLAKRTGYEPAYFCIHPDSRKSLQFHVGLCSISDDNLLMGRSKGGTRGRRGLVFVGEAFLNVWRFSRHAKIPGSRLALPKISFEEKGVSWDSTDPLEGRVDDVATSLTMEAALAAAFPELVSRVQVRATAISTRWSKKIKKRRTYSELVERVKELEAQLGKEIS
jgi:hypothetical protein